jgi:hypothetical protein
MTRIVRLVKAMVWHLNDINFHGRDSKTWELSQPLSLEVHAFKYLVNMVGKNPQPSKLSPNQLVLRVKSVPLLNLPPTTSKMNA